MPLDPTAQSALIVASLSGQGISGTAVPSISSSISSALVSYVLALPVTTVDAGMIGVGVGSVPLSVASLGGLNPSVLHSLLRGYLVGSGIGGQFVDAVSLGISLGFVSHLSSALVVTQHPTVGAGSAVGTIGPADPVSLTAIVSSSLQGNGVTGTAVPNISSSLASAVAVFLSSVVLVIPIIGVPGPVPSSGAGTGRLA